MRRIVLSLVVAAFLLELTLTPADAFIFRLFRRRRSRNYVSAPAYQFSGDAQAVAEQKAARMAAEGRWAHYGGSFGGCRYEGVGSGSTAQEALNNCCYSNSGKVIGGQAAVQSANGRWYACRLYY